jgi:hypothetical protein
MASEAIVVFMTAANGEEAARLADMLVVLTSPPVSRSFLKLNPYTAGKERSSDNRKFSCS